MEIVVIGSSIESTIILAMLWTENPHVMTAAGGILNAIFDGFTASLIYEEEGQGRRKRCSKQI